MAQLYRPRVDVARVDAPREEEEVHPQTGQPEGACSGVFLSAIWEDREDEDTERWWRTWHDLPPMLFFDGIMKPVELVDKKHYCIEAAPDDCNFARRFLDAVMMLVEHLKREFVFVEVATDRKPLPQPDARHDYAIIGIAGNASPIMSVFQTQIKKPTRMRQLVEPALECSFAAPVLGARIEPPARLRQIVSV
jgi:hypothetical protein